MDDEELTADAEAYYVAYCNDANWVSVGGDNLPGWSELREDIRAHWVAVAATARERTAAS